MIHKKKYRLRMVSKNISLEGLHRFHGANLNISSNLLRKSLLPRKSMSWALRKQQGVNVFQQNS